MLRLALLYSFFIMLLFFSFWLVLGKEFNDKFYIIIIVSLFLSMMLMYISYELSKYRINLVKELLRKKDKKIKKQSAKLRFKNSQLENLLSGISHEFKNPITVIKMSAQTLFQKNIEAHIKNKFVEKIISNANRLNSVLDRLRIIFTDGITPSIALIDLKKLCVSVAEDLEQKYSSQRIRIQGDKYIKADYFMIYQVLLNLCENALKYSNKDVLIVLNNSGIFIKDYGKGIEDNKLKIVQKKFYRGKDYDWNNSLGLGLYIVKLILKLHNFEFIIKSKKNFGSIFGFKVENAKSDKF